MSLLSYIILHLLMRFSIQMVSSSKRHLMRDVSGACYEESVYFLYATMILVYFLHLLKGFISDLL